jgi:hypothetical protein
MGSATSVHSNAHGAELLAVLRREARQPRDLTDLGVDIDTARARAEVTRLRGLLRHMMADESFVALWLRPPGYHGVRIPTPSPAELRAILDSQVKKRAALDARARIRK